MSLNSAERTLAERICNADRSGSHIIDIRTNGVYVCPQTVKSYVLERRRDFKNILIIYRGRFEKEEDVPLLGYWGNEIHLLYEVIIEK